MSFEQNPVDPEREKQIQTIVEQLEEKGWMKVLVNESIGGNAGRNRAAVNGFARKDTGEIVAWGNIQDIKSEIRYNPEFGVVSFLYDFGDSFPVATQRMKAENAALEYFVDVGGTDLSSQALENLKEAIARYNEIYKAEQVEKRK